MRSMMVEVTNPYGLTFSDAGRIVRAVRELQAEVTVECGHRTASATDLLGLVMLRASCRRTLQITASGADEQRALAAVEDVFAPSFARNRPETVLV